MSIASVVFRVSNRVLPVDVRKVAVVFEVRSGKAVMQAVRIKPHIGIMSEEERPSGAHADVEFDPVIGMAIAVVISIGRARPSASITEGRFRLSCPSRVVHGGGARMRWACTS